MLKPTQESTFFSGHETALSGDKGVNGEKIKFYVYEIKTIFYFDRRNFLKDFLTRKSYFL